jgi:Ice-binding-like/Secretion system C-terminal sorting domain
MKTNALLNLATVFIMVSSPTINYGQAPNLGSAANFVLFSTVGAVSNTGISQLTGNVGSNSGATTGFSSLNGAVFNTDIASALCSADLLVAYNQLNLAVPTFFPGVLLGNGQIFTPGVYSIAAATTLNLGLTLDAQGDPNAVFIIQIQGAFSTTTNSTINLINGASACNVFWKVEGAVSMAAGSTLRGTIIANNAAISLAAGDTLEGRALSTTGAVAVNAALADVGCGFVFVNLPIVCLSFTGACDNQNVLLKWSTATEANNGYFTIERSAEKTDWLAIGTVEGAGNSSAVLNYSFSDTHPGQSISYYRLKQTDLDGNSKYGTVIAVEKCGGGAAESLTLYPNPSNGIFVLLFTGDRSLVNSTELFNSRGEKISGSIGFQSNFDLSNSASGIYLLQVHLNSKTINREIVLKK